MTKNGTDRETGGGAMGDSGVPELVNLGEGVCLSILHEMPDGFVLIDGEEVCRYMNPAFTRITGYTREDAPTVNAWFERAHPNPAYRQRVTDMQQELHQGGRSSMVASVVCGDGRVRDLEFRWASIEGGWNLITARDITEQALVEERLSQATSELTAVIESFPDLFFRLNADGTILDFRAGRLAEMPIGQGVMLGRRVQDILPAGIGEAFSNALKEAVRTNAPAEPLEFSLADGAVIRYYEARVVPLYELHMMAIIREITVRKRAEQELHRYRDHLEELVNERTGELERANQELERLLYYIETTERRAAEEWLDSSVEQGAILGSAGPEEAQITTDVAGKAIFVSPEVEGLTGYTADELAEKPVWSFFSGGDVQDILFSDVLGRGKSVARIEGAVLLKSDGSGQSVHLSADPILDAAGVVIGMTCTIQKI